MIGPEMYQTFKQSLVVLLYAFIAVSVNGQDCIYQECYCADTSIVCEERELTRIPPKTSTLVHYTTLNLDVNAIKDIPAGSLPMNLIGLYLEQNPLTTIAETAFDDSASTLQTLYISSALIKRIPDAFQHLKSLNELSLQDLNIDDWNEEAMKNIGKPLVSLSLDNVGITSWPTWLQYFSNLTQLTITRGSISSIPDDAFDNLTNTLTSLSIFNNNLANIPKAFSKFKVLQELHIQQNKIKDVSWLPPESRLTILSLSNNLISDENILSNALFPHGDSLVDLDITSNRLTAIPNFTFLTRFGYFDFSYNRLSDPNSGAVTLSVQSINFDHNFLPSIPRVLKTLPSVSQLTLPSNSIRQIHALDFPASTTVIDLGFNLITELSDDSFPSNSIITSLYLNNNPIVTISNLAFKNIGDLRELNLQSTRLSRLPLALGSLTSLDFLDMTNIPNLVCTCQEKSLEHWILSFAYINLLGNCGLMEIDQFFSKLSPSCPP